MSRYRRQHEGANLSKGVYWLLFAAVLAYMVYKVVSCKRAADQLHKATTWQSYPTVKPHWVNDNLS